jgi:hypothetical protein
MYSPHFFAHFLIDLQFATEGRQARNQILSVLAAIDLPILFFKHLSDLSRSRTTCPVFLYGHKSPVLTMPYPACNLSCIAVFVPPVMYHLFFLSCSVPPVLFRLSFATFLSRLSCPTSPSSVFSSSLLSCLSCPRRYHLSSVPPVLYHLFCPAYSVPPVLYHMFCPACPLSYLFWPPAPSSTILFPAPPLLSHSS